jgi:hypothetical protein
MQIKSSSKTTLCPREPNLRELEIYKKPKLSSRLTKEVTREHLRTIKLRLQTKSSTTKLVSFIAPLTTQRVTVRTNVKN